jgi:leucyl aminopeptidase (aminopeptidase T)
MVKDGVIGPKLAPSFLIECLVYAVEDWYFTATCGDERYGRVLQVVERISTLLADPQWVQVATEINGIKFLFRPGQAWTADGARQFVQAAHARLLGI